MADVFLIVTWLPLDQLFTIDKEEASLIQC